MQHDHRGVLLADIGGTTARFACLIDEVLGPVEHLASHGYASFADALSDFLARRDSDSHLSAAVLAMAGVINDERCALTNIPWIIDAAELQGRFGFSRVRLVNDFEAIAWSLPHLGRADLYALGGRRPGKSGAPLAVLGPGTGFGVAALVPCGDRATVLASEGGHSTLPAGSPREGLVIEHLQQQFGHVSTERVLSGPGLENLYRTIAKIDGATVPERSAADIVQAATNSCCPTSKAALDMFCAMLGNVVGDLALTFGARGGVFIAGGIVPRIAGYVAESQFRERFEAKGRLRFYVEAVPVDVILNTDAAFVGLRSLAASRLEPAEISPLSSAASNASMAISSVATRCTEDRQSANR